MKNYLKLIIITFIIPIFISFNGCILDALNDITVNMPFATDTLTISGSQSSISQSETFDIAKSEIYQQYKDKLNSITFVKAQFRTMYVSNPNIAGNITVNLTGKNNIPIFSITMNNVKPADYTNTPFKLNLNQSQISAFNQYLNNSANTVFTGTVSVNNISGGSIPRVIKVIIDIVFSINAKT